MSKFNVNYHKIKKIVLEDLEKMYQETKTNDTEEKCNYHPFHMKNSQCYNPIYNIFFEMNELNYDLISLNHKYRIHDLKYVIDNESGSQIKRDSFIKFAPLLDPIRFLIGKYKDKKETLTTLPSYNIKTNHKLGNPNNASYVDNFFCYLSSQLLHHHGCKNAIDYYGSFLGIQEKYKFNAADDIDYLVQSEYFTHNKGKIYEIEEVENPFANFGSRNNKNKLLIHNTSDISHISLEELEVLDIDCHNQVQSHTEQVIGEIINTNCIYEKNESETSSINSSNNSELNYSDDEETEEDDEETEEDDEETDEDDEETEEDDEETEEDDEETEEDDEETEEDDEETDEDDEESEEEPQINAFIYDFPVQMICLEKCKGTLDELFVKKVLDLDTAASALFQVIMTLLIYQKVYHFTHNDLHTNNIMFIETDQEYITYKYANTYYKVPTYGKLFKIIDYGRAIYKFKGKMFCSDSFAPEGDAYTQYNFEPYFNEKKPRLDPNYSFDLCRLGCSIYDFILEVDDENEKEFQPDDLQRTIIRWITDDNGKNVLYMKNGDERYKNFKLYKMIARTVHAHTPEAQLADPFFNQFKIDEKIEDSIDIDAIPCYA
jgi:hypothetical protein